MADTGTALSTEVATEIREIEPMIGDHGSDYWRGSRSAELQIRYRSLLEARDAGTPPPAKVSSAAKRIAELEKMIGNHGSPYWRGDQAPALQAEYRDLISGQSGTPAGGVEWRATPAQARRNLDPALVAEWDATADGFNARLTRAQNTFEVIMFGIGDPERVGWMLNDFYGFIKPEVRRAILGELATPASVPLDGASDAEVDLFATTPEGKNLVGWWGSKARRNVAIVRARWDRMTRRLDAESLAQFNHWFHAFSPAEQQAIYHALTTAAA